MRTRTSWTSLERAPIALLAGFGGVFGLITFVNHWLLRTAAFDLGLSAHALHDFAHLRGHITTLLLDTPPTSFFSSHLALLPVLAAPLYWVFGASWALLVVQWAAIIAGGWGVWVVARAHGLSSREGALALAFFLSQWSLYSALGFDYHDNVVGAMLLPWLAYWLGRERWGRAVLAFSLLLVSKENMALWAVVVLIGLAWRHADRPRVRTVALMGAGLALIYFAVITKVVMPALDTTHRPFTQLARYQHLGESLEGAIWNVATHPALLFRTLFVNTLPDPSFNYVKLELWAVLVLSGGWLTLWRPWYGLMLAPVLAQKLLSSDAVLWGINYHYSVEFAPVLALAAIEAAQRLAAPAQTRLLTTLLLLAATTTIVTLYVRQSKWYHREATNFLIGSHYRTPYDVPRLHAALRRVPADVPLSAHPHLAPWLVERAGLYHFPMLGDARLIALQQDSTRGWPLSAAEYGAAVHRLRADPTWRVVEEDDQFLLLAR
ncbi:MAG: DUF2079 domain-containing protein [Hymenobacteraceae bacterium]|nr:DUF2079 domain-containing protein [Hymenobacteraceae bacterium]